MSLSGLPEPQLTPFVGPLREAAAAELAMVVRDWLHAPSARVESFRSGSPKNEVPTELIIRDAGAVLHLLLRRGTGDWRAGPLSFTVRRDAEALTHPVFRGWLQRLGSYFEGPPAPERDAFGERLARVHHRWATLQVAEDRDYRHIEHAHSGRHAFLRPSFRCNQDCHFCWEGRDWPEPAEALVLQWLEQLAQAPGVNSVTFCGGEPTLYRALPDLIARASHDHGLRVHMNTNAIRLRDRAFARGLKDSGLTSILVSFHSADRLVSDVMTRAPRTWDRTVEGIHGALDVGLTVLLNCVVEAANVGGLADHARFVRTHFVEAHPDNPVRMVNYSQPGKYYDGNAQAEQIVPLDVARPRVTEAARILHESGVLLEITGSCGFPACVASDIPSMVPWRRENTVDPRHASARVHDPAACQGCAARAHCVGPRREYLARWGDRGLVPFAALPTSDWYERVATAGLGEEWAAPVGQEAGVSK